MVIAVGASEPWLKLLGLADVLVLITSLALGFAAAYGVMLLLSGLVARLTEQSVQKLPILPEWQKRNAGD